MDSFCKSVSLWTAFRYIGYGYVSSLVLDTLDTYLPSRYTVRCWTVLIPCGWTPCCLDGYCYAIAVVRTNSYDSLEYRVIVPPAHDLDPTTQRKRTAVSAAPLARYRVRCVTNRIIGEDWSAHLCSLTPHCRRHQAQRVARTRPTPRSNHVRNGEG